MKSHWYVGDVASEEHLQQMPRQDRLRAVCAKLLLATGHSEIYLQIEHDTPVLATPPAGS